MNGITIARNVRGLALLASVAGLKVGKIHALIVAKLTKSAQHRVHWTGRYVALIVISLGISFSVRSVGIVPRPASNANR